MENVSKSSKQSSNHFSENLNVSMALLVFTAINYTCIRLECVAVYGFFFRCAFIKGFGNVVFKCVLSGFHVIIELGCFSHH